MTTTTLVGTPDPDNPLLVAALAAAARGWHVFPVAAGSKVPALHGFQSCPRTGVCAAGHRGWEQRATTEAERIRGAWSAGPFNVGIACGPSGLVVVDLDAAKGDQPPLPWDTEPGVTDGQDVLAVLAERAGQPLPVDTYTVATAGGGAQLYYRVPGGARLRNTQGKLGWKIDTRAAGGYVVAAGSIINGRTYRTLVDTDPMMLPAWLATELNTTPPPPPPAAPVRTGTGRVDRYVQAAINAEQARVRAADKGHRNATLYTAAVALGQLVAGHALTETHARASLLDACTRHLGRGNFTHRAANDTITSGLNAGRNRPRQVAA